METEKILESRDEIGNVEDKTAVESEAGEVCRLCLRKIAKARFWGIFETDLPQKLMKFTTVQIQENDGLPTVVCSPCRNLVYMSYNFKCQVEKSDRDLRQTLLSKQSTTHWPTVPIVKSVESINSVEALVPCMQKDIINSCVTVQDEQKPNSHEQFMFEIANSCNIGNETCKKENQTESDNSVDVPSMTENSNVVSFEIDNAISNHSVKKENDITFESQYEVKNELIDDIVTVKCENIQENSNPSDDEKPLILRTKRHKCNYCIKSFACLTLLEKHAVIHKQPEKIYICYLCDAEFPSVDEVKSHATAIHEMSMERERILESMRMRRITGWVKKVNDTTMEVCDTPTENAKEKINTKFTCKFCCRQFSYHKPFMAHIKTHPDYNDKVLNELIKAPVVVDVTSEENSKTNPSTNTVTTAHPSNPCSVNSEITTQATIAKTVSQSVNVEVTSLQSNDKVGNFSHRDSMEESEDDDGDQYDDGGGGDCDDDDDDDDDDENDDDNGDDGNGEDDNDGDKNEGDNMPVESIQCNQCGKLVSTLRNLKRHLLTHSGLKHNCSICGKDFSRPDKLREHQQLKHKEEVFGKSDTENESSDEKHVVVNRKKEKNKRPHKCPLCPKAFAQPQSLANHEERHKRDRDMQKRFLCEVCSKCFAQSGSLVAHMRTHTGVKPYVCNVCSRAFTKSTYLQLHLRTHSGEKPYICQYCSRAFARANTLARHITMHTGEAKYQCQICTKSFRRLTSLNEHTYTHTGQRPYACKICSKRYNNAGSLYAHTKKCKAMHATAETTYEASLQPTDNDVVQQSNINPPPQVLVFTEKKLDETITDDTIACEAQTCQFMITNVHSEKTMMTNELEPFTIQESDVYNVNSKQFKAPFYALYPIDIHDAWCLNLN